MKCSGRRATFVLLPLLLFVTACTDPVVYVEEPAEVETCEKLVPVGIELVIDYVTTLEQTDLGPTGGDPGELPDSLVALNGRGEELDRRAAELECDLAELNRAIAEATAGIETSDPEAQVLLETVRSGAVAIEDALEGEWEFVSGSNAGEPIELAPGQTIRLTIDEAGVPSGSTGCNEYSSVHPAADGQWPDGFELTAAPCPSSAYSQGEASFTTAYSLVQGYVVEGERLTLTGTDVDLRFIRVGAAGPDSTGVGTQP